jgi:sodium transport system permease protein
MSLNWRDVAVFYKYELKGALRERSIVLNSLLIPIFMYPLLLWAMFTGITFVVGQTEGIVSRVMVRDSTGHHEALKDLIAKQEKVKLVPDSGGTADEIAREIEAERLDAFLEVAPVPAGSGSPPGNFSARLLYDQSKDASDQARRRLEEAVQLYRTKWLEGEAQRRGVAGPQWQEFVLERKNVASRRQMGRLILSQMLPLFLIIMVAIGCFYPAVDSTAGERERSTWETSMSTAASRRSILTAKYLYVATLGCVAGLINLTSMLLSARVVLAPLTRQAGEALEFQIPLTAAPVMAIGTVLLALFVAAVMMLLASFARTFREGQAMITPFYLAVFIPAIFARPDQPFTVVQSLIPILNVSKLFARAITGEVQGLTTVLTLASEIVCVMVALRLAAAVTRFEDFMIGSYSGSLGKFVKERLLGRKRLSGSAAGDNR